MADIFESRANKTKGLAFIALLQLIDTFNGFFVQDVTADSVMRVGWIDDDTASSQYIDRLLNETTLGVDGIYFKQHNFTIFCFYY
jgi:hypothetical protein